MRKIKNIPNPNKISDKELYFVKGNSSVMLTSTVFV